MTPLSSNRRDLRSEQGVFLPLVAGIFIAILAILGLALDVVVVYKSQINVQKAVDAGAISGANLILKPLGNQMDEAGIRSAAEKMARVNLQLAGFLNSEIVHITVQYSVAAANPTDGSPVSVSAAVRPHLYILDKIPGIRSAIISSANAVATARSIMVTIVLDRSGSMNATLPGDPNNKLSYLQTAALNFVQRFRGTRDMVSLVSFSDRSKTLVPMNDLFDTSADLTAHRDNLEAQISGLSAAGATNHSSAIYRAWDSMRARAATYPLLPRYVVIFTDGGSTASSANWKPAAGGSGFTSRLANRRPSAAGDWYFNTAGLGDNIDGTNYWYDLSFGGEAGFCLYNVGSTYGLFLAPHSFVPLAGSSLNCGERLPNPSLTPPDPGALIQSLSQCIGVGNEIGFYDPEGKLYTEPGTIIDYMQEAVEQPLCMNIPVADYSLANWRYSKLHYLTAIAAADFIRRQGVFVYTIGLGEQDPNVSDFYQSLAEPHLRKDFALNRIANDQVNAAQLGYPNVPAGKGVATYSQSQAQRHGKYMATDTGQDLDALFQEVFRDIKLQLVQ